jgi:hypothetical protein
MAAESAVFARASCDGDGDGVGAPAAELCVFISYL